MNGAGSGSGIPALLLLLAKNIVKHDPSLTAREIDLAAWECLGRILALRACGAWGYGIEGDLASLADERDIHGTLEPLLETASQEIGDALLPWGMAHPRRTTHLPFVEDAVLRRVILGVPKPDGGAAWLLRVSECVETALQHEVGKEGGISLVPRAEPVAIGGFRTTPRWLVDYCAESLVHKLTSSVPGGAQPVIRVLDPACGCGMYLQGVCRAFAAGGTKEPSACPALSGVDRDPRAVDAARILLLLSLIRDRRGQVPVHGLREQIRWGDPIVSPTLREEDRQWFTAPGSWLHAGPVDWIADFPGASGAGGFDGVICSPPIRVPGVHRALSTHLQEWYRAYPGGDLAGVYYAEKGLSLLREGGMLCMVLDRRWLRARSGAGLRRLLRECGIREIVDLGTFPLWGAVRAHGSILQAGPPPPGRVFRACRLQDTACTDVQKHLEQHCRTLDLRDLDSGGWTLTDPRVARLVARLTARGTPLERFAAGGIHAGVTLPGGGTFIADETRKHIIRKDPLAASLFRQVVLPEHILPGWISTASASCVLVVRDQSELAHFPAVVRVLRGVHAGQIPAFTARWEFERPKLLIAAGDHRIFAAPDRCGRYPYRGVMAVGGTSPYLLGILNSRLIRLFWNESVEKRALTTLAKIPVYIPDPYDEQETLLAGELTHLVENLTHNLECASGEEVPSGKGEGIVQEIDRIVYRLYGLDEEDIALVHEYTR